MNNISNDLHDAVNAAVKPHNDHPDKMIEPLIRNFNK